MQNRNIVITGGTDGMGKAVAIRLAKLGPRLLLISRNPNKGNAAVAEIKQLSGNNDVTFLQANLSLAKNVKRAAEQIRETFDRLDVLVHAAGNLFPGKRTLTDEGLELSFAIQCMARFLLTNELLGLLHAAPDPQVLSLMGGGTITGQVDFDNLQGEKSYGRFQAINATSRAGDLLTLGQIECLPNITFYNYGPGLVRSGQIVRNPVTGLFFNSVGRLFSRSPEEAADDIVLLLTGQYDSGFYIELGKENDLPECADAQSIKRMWEYNEAVVDKILVTA